MRGPASLIILIDSQPCLPTEAWKSAAV